ncbi:MAG TPA: hypothetical protein VF881_12885 [Polyangiaceae bacterium]
MSNKAPRSKKRTANPGAKHPKKMSHSAARAAAGRSDEGRAFLPDPYDGAGAPARTGQNLAETLAEEFVSSATNAGEITEDQRDEVQTEELGGPFTQTSAQEEFATEPDASNPLDAEREPFPTATRHPGG